MVKAGTYAAIYAVVAKIPRGRVATYGQVAALAGLPGHARQVGYALNALPDGVHVPWHRVINALGGISRRSDPGSDDLQRVLLEREGVRFGPDGRLSLDSYAWRPRRPSPGRAKTRRGRA
jgi:methylated-DNA-protein-cysteine methyltransferase-like protein